MSAKHVNHLANEKSPYLLQHVHSPIDWYPWGEEAFAKAKEEDKPNFLVVAIVHAIGAMWHGDGSIDRKILAK